MKSIIALCLLVAVVQGQFHGNIYNLLTHPAALQTGSIAFPAATHSLDSVAHPAVIENAAMEAHLPEELKNNQYKDPVIAANLAKESWFGHKEMPVGHRDADDVPRSEIFKIIERAGFNEHH